MKKILFLIALIIGGVFAYSILSIGSTTVVKGDYIIQKGDTLSQIPKRLNLDVNPTFYKIWLKLNAPEINLKAGTYEIKENSTLSEVLKNALNKPVSLDKELTILPGWNIFDIDEMLAAKGIIKAGELIAYSDAMPSSIKAKYSFLKDAPSLEGFIYPETYRIPLDAKLDNVLEITLDTFEERIYNEFKSSRVKGKDFYDMLIMASIIEREERDPQNKPIVAGILLKRLEQGISIGADATVCYEYRKTFKECTPSFIGEKIYIKSKYNTRNKVGLPPTPISNLTADTFKATASPESSPYYYYLHDMKGNIHYGKTLDDHNRNKNLYLK